MKYRGTAIKPEDQKAGKKPFVTKELFNTPQEAEDHLKNFFTVPMIISHIAERETK